MALEKNLKIALYSDDSSVRSSVVTALGRRVSAELPEHQIIEFATGPALRLYLDSKGAVDLFILDGEAVPEGGLGLARQLKDEVFKCPPVLVITGPEPFWNVTVIAAPVSPVTVTTPDA